jgi:para-nitrobenzyl esterase
MIEIDTPAGRLAGTATGSDGRGVHAFLGIPYATATRFAPPEVVTSWTGTRDATAFGPAAPQPVGGPLDGLVPGSFRGETDEDACLTLNVWTPATASAQPRPVLVWFPGGAFTIGATSQPAYDGARFSAEQDVVFVSCNYRLGALGFLDARDIGGVANCGLRDAIAALAWIQRNIDGFGGDPERVTAFGESAGGGLVLHLLASPHAGGLFGAAIVQSGATFNTLDDVAAATVRDALLAELGATDAKGLYDVGVDELLQAQSATAMAVLATVGMMPFHPMVDGDVLPAAPAVALAAGSAAGIPMVIGTTTDEMRLFLDLSGPPAPRDKLARRVERYVGVDATRAETIVATYEAELGTTDTNEIWAGVFTDKEMAVPAAAMREAQRAHAPVYSYLFGRPAAVGNLGACHGIDIPFTFGNFVDGWADFVGLDDEAERLGRTIRDAWAAFARTRDPGWPGAPQTRRLETGTLVNDPLRARLASLG